MKWSTNVTIVNTHAEGEVGRVVTAGVEDFPGRSMLDRMTYLNEVDDSLRRFLVFEPRACAQMSTNLLLPPTRDDADAGFIVLQADKAHAMSVSNTICFVTFLLETGIFPIEEWETIVNLDTPAGLVRTVVRCRDGMCETVSIEPKNARRLVELGTAIQRVIQDEWEIVHPIEPSLKSLSYVMFIEETKDNRMRGASVLPAGRIDRSPCSTGNSARLALRHGRGQARVGDTYPAFSIIGGRLDVHFAGVTKIANRPAVLPGVTGRGWIQGTYKIELDPTDAFEKEYLLSDTWGDAFDLLN